MTPTDIELVLENFSEPLTHLRTFLLHKVRENCHFLDHPPTPMSLRNIKIAPYVTTDTYYVQGQPLGIEIK